MGEKHVFPLCSMCEWNIWTRGDTSCIRTIMLLLASNRERHYPQKAMKSGCLVLQSTHRLAARQQDNPSLRRPARRSEVMSKTDLKRRYNLLPRCFVLCRHPKFRQVRSVGCLHMRV